MGMMKVVLTRELVDALKAVVGKSPVTTIAAQGLTSAQKDALLAALRGAVEEVAPPTGVKPTVVIPPAKK